MKKIIIGVITLAVVAGGVVLFNNINKTENNNNKNTQNNMLSGLIIEKIANKTTKFGEGIEAVLYKEPGCSCCEGYAKELRTQGFDVKVVPTKDIDSVKNKYKIPTDKQSCHTVAINNYFVEGHVPMKAVRELLEQKSEIKGIGLPGMPAGAPGMPGTKTAPYKIYQESKNGDFSNYMTI